MDSIRIQFAEPADAAEIASLLSGGFPPEVAPLLIYSCKGAPEYIRMQLASGIPNAESAYFVARAPDRIAGAIELRRQPGSLFLNYIGVHPGYRGRRVGTALLSAGVRMAGVDSGQIALDVLFDNTRALRWYSRLGFATGTSAELLELAPPRGADEEPAFISGLPQADLCQERFGFSRFSLTSRQGIFPVGRTGDTWFRLTDLAAVTSPGTFAALNTLDPRRRVFGVLPPASAPPGQVVRLLAKTHRMAAEIPHLMSSLLRDH